MGKKVFYKIVSLMVICAIICYQGMKLSYFIIIYIFSTSSILNEFLLGALWKLGIFGIILIGLGIVLIIINSKKIIDRSLFSYTTLIPVFSSFLFGIGYSFISAGIVSLLFDYV
jgi:predicted Kef-type K+ transport protein